MFAAAGGREERTTPPALGGGVDRRLGHAAGEAHGELVELPLGRDQRLVAHPRSPPRSRRSGSHRRRRGPVSSPEGETSVSNADARRRRVRSGSGGSASSARRKPSRSARTPSKSVWPAPVRIDTDPLCAGWTWMSTSAESCPMSRSRSVGEAAAVAPVLVRIAGVHPARCSTEARSPRRTMVAIRPLGLGPAAPGTPCPIVFDARGERSGRRRSRRSAPVVLAGSSVEWLPIADRRTG